MLKSDIDRRGTNSFLSLTGEVLVVTVPCRLDGLVPCGWVPDLGGCRCVSTSEVCHRVFHRVSLLVRVLSMVCLVRWPVGLEILVVNGIEVGARHRR